MALLPSISAIPSSLIGGKIFSIFLRQAILRQKAEFKKDLRVKTISNPLIYLFESIPVTSRKQEVYTYTTNVTQHAIEDGSIVTDHAILMPVEIDLSFEISNLDPNMVQYSFNLLVQIRNQRVPFDLLTEHSEVPNVIITNLKMTNGAPLWKKIEGQVSFKQLSIVKIETVDFPIEKVKYPTIVEGQTRPPDPDVSKSAEAPINTGLKIPKTPTSSLFA